MDSRLAPRSPLEGERARVFARAEGGEQLSESLSSTPSLALPLKGEGNVRGNATKN